MDKIINPIMGVMGEAIRNFICFILIAIFVAAPLGYFYVSNISWLVGVTNWYGQIFGTAAAIIAAVAYVWIIV